MMGRRRTVKEIKDDIEVFLNRLEELFRKDKQLPTTTKTVLKLMGSWIQWRVGFRVNVSIRSNCSTVNFVGATIAVALNVQTEFTICTSLLFYRRLIRLKKDIDI